jgi:hypothetical protein
MFVAVLRESSSPASALLLDRNDTLAVLKLPPAFVTKGAVGPDALNTYRQQFSEVRALIARVPAPANEHLRLARGSLQKAGKGVLEHARNHTFHYPSPDSHYDPPSDEESREALFALGDHASEVHYDCDSGQITLTFAEDVALTLAMSTLAGSPEEVMRRAETARDGALNFVLWVSTLVKTYMDVNGHCFGEPLVKQKTDQGRE